MKKRTNTYKFISSILLVKLNTDCIYNISKFCTKYIYWYESQHHLILIKQSRKEKYHTLHIIKTPYHRFNSLCR